MPSSLITGIGIGLFIVHLVRAGIEIRTAPGRIAENYFTIIANLRQQRRAIYKRLPEAALTLSSDHFAPMFTADFFRHLGEVAINVKYWPAVSCRHNDANVQCWCVFNRDLY